MNRARTRCWRPLRPVVAVVAVVAVALVGCVSGADAGVRSEEPREAPASTAVAERVTALLDELPPPSDDGLTHEIALDDPDGALARAFERGLARAAEREGTLRIAFFGSSHVAGDLVTGILRQRLQRHFGDAGRGFVTAVPPYGSYWQWGVRVEEGEGWSVAEPNAKDMSPGAYGLTGMGFDAVEPAWAAIETEGSTASHLEVHYLRQPGGGPLSVSIDGAHLTIDTAFEREAAGIEYVALRDGPHRVEVAAGGEASARLYGFVLERAASGVIVDQLGVNGMTPAVALLSDAAIAADFLRARRPDVVAVWLGANEASELWPFDLQDANLRALVGRLRETAPSAACLIIGPLDRRQHAPDGTPFVPAALAALVEIHRVVARDLGCAYFDAFAWHGGAGAVERFEAADPPLIRGDRLHLTQAGYVRFGASLLRALLSPLRGHAPARTRH